MRIYLDHAATTCTDKRVLEKMLPYFAENCGNASSLHRDGRDARGAVNNARAQMAKAIGAGEKEIYFTSGGTESDNWALKGVAECAGQGHIITSCVEHHAVMDACRYLEARGFEVTYLPVDSKGMVDAQSVERAFRNDTILISIMFANNETGTIMPVEHIGEIAKSHGVLFHTDAVQAVGHIPVDVSRLHIDMLSMSAHKFYGPKGVGALYIREGTRIAKFMHGGSQERDMRAGTINTPGIVGIGAAIELASMDMDSNVRHEAKLTKQLIDGILSRFPQACLNGHETMRLPGHANIMFGNIEANALLIALDLGGISVSTGSACTAGSYSPSYVLKSIGLSDAEANASLRFSIGRENSDEEIEAVIEIISAIIRKNC